MLSKSFIEKRFAPFKYSGFRLIFFSQGVSLTGSWMQELAKSWIVLNLTKSATAMGGLLMAAAIPNVIFGALGGVIADRKEAKAILLWTQILLSVCAFALGILVSGGHIAFWHLIAFAIIEGTVLAFDIPAMNTVTPQLVPREHFQQALALNSVNFHMSRVIGPSLAGLVMGMSGPASVFWVNGVSFIGVVWAISRIAMPKKEVTTHVPTAKEARGETWRYIKSKPVLAAILIQFVLVMSLVFPLVFTTLRLYIQERFHLGAKEFGLVFAAPGAGALIGSMYFFLASPKKPLVVLPWGIGGVVLSLIALAEAPTLTFMTISLMAYSISMFLTLSALLVTVQLTIEHHIRGRISALVGMAFASLAPIMAGPMGVATDALGAHDLLLVVAVAFGALSTFVGLRGLRHEIWAPAKA
ncbi:MAG: MFS transporter [Bdellovibrionales bacterium]|nr:MFS transporter [Bdellovibrionales bacterium]